LADSPRGVRRRHRSGLGPGGITVGALAAVVLTAASVTAALRPASTTTTGDLTRQVSRPRPVAATVPLSGPPTWIQTTHQLAFGGMARSYLLVRPQASGTRLPLVVVLHGRNASPEMEAARTGFTTVTGPAVLVYPQGYGLFWNAGACCGAAQQAGVDDVGFVTAVVRDVEAANPDTAGGQVFLVGYSNGGKLAYRLACAEPTVFRAVAAVGAVAVAPCPQPAPVAFIEAAWAGDPELSFAAATPRIVNGYTELNVDVQLQQRAQANGCAGSTSSTAGSLTTTAWSGCVPGHPVELAVYQGVSHTWPAGHTTTPSAEAVIWRFFQGLGPTT